MYCDRKFLKCQLIYPTLEYMHVSYIAEDKLRPSLDKKKQKGGAQINVHNVTIECSTLDLESQDYTAPHANLYSSFNSSNKQTKSRLLLVLLSIINYMKLKTASM